MKETIVNPLRESGLLLISKPSGPTSYDMIRLIKRKRQGLKIGHCGTLDPLAEGLLLILLGRATKDQDMFMKKEKVYRARIRLGLRTDSGDITGSVLENIPTFEFPTIEKLTDVFKKFLGEQDQTPPMVSAVKHEGVPLYKLARQGKIVDRKPKHITIYELNLLTVSPPNELEFRLRCSSGTYVRVLAEDIGKELGLPAAVSFLIREKIGPYSVDDAIAGQSLADMTWDDILNRKVLYEKN